MSDVSTLTPEGVKFVEDIVAKFAAFYTEQERERCAKIAEAESEAPGEMPDELLVPLEAAIRAAIRATKKSIARAIRAGQ